MAHVNASVDLSRALAKLKMVESEARAGIARALNKTMTTARATASDEIKSAGYGLKVGDIKGALSIRRADARFLQAAVRAKGRPIPLIKYQARQTKKGVTVSVKGGRKLIAGAFIATMSSGHMGVFTRKKGMVQGKRGQPILNRKLSHELFGPAVPGMFVQDAVQRGTVAAIRTRFPVVLDQELAYLRSQGMA